MAGTENGIWPKRRFECVIIYPVAHENECKNFDRPFFSNTTRGYYETIKQKAEACLRPVNRTKEWKREERRKDKDQRKRLWYQKGGYDSVLFVPVTPKSKLKKMYQREIKQSGIRIRVVEKCGRTLKSHLQRSNPFKRRNCGRQDCLVCTTTNSGNCETEGITYENTCDGEGCVRRYKGESSYCAYKRGKEHVAKLIGKSDKSPHWKHCERDHAGVMQTFTMRVTGSFKNDAMLRQITEAVQIENTPTEELMNTRTEWNMTRVPRMNILST